MQIAYDQSFENQVRCLTSHDSLMCGYYHSLHRYPLAATMGKIQIYMQGNVYVDSNSA